MGLITSFGQAMRDGGFFGTMKRVVVRAVRAFDSSGNQRRLTYQPRAFEPNADDAEELSAPVAHSSEAAVRPGDRNTVREDPNEDLLRKRAAGAARRVAIMDAFDSAHPVERRGDLLGRGAKLDLMFDTVLEQGHHAIVHGARGSGKTSLVRVFGDYADQNGAVVVYLACEPTDTFTALLLPYLDFIPSSAMHPGGPGRMRDTLASEGKNLTPRLLTSLLAETVSVQTILVLDEFDRVTDLKLQDHVATFMKLLSDARVPVQLVLVGIAQNVNKLIDSHLSLRRHVTAIDVDRLSEAESREIVERGASICGIEFESAAVDLIAAVSAGSPYHVRLFCQAAGMAMLRSGQTKVDGKTALEGLQSAASAWGQLNERDYQVFLKACKTDGSRRSFLRGFVSSVVCGDADRQYSAFEIAEARDMIGEALNPDSHNIAFVDTLAPQFLLGLLAAEDALAPVSSAKHVKV